MPSYSLQLIWLISPQVCIMKCQERIEQSEEERIDSYMPTYPPVSALVIFLLCLPFMRGVHSLAELR